jgi:hypothetical protein
MPQDGPVFIHDEWGPAYRNSSDTAFYFPEANMPTRGDSFFDAGPGAPVNYSGVPTSSSSGGALTASLIGAGLSYLGGRERNEAQRDAAREQMRFQERLSNTGYQRVMADMAAAGLNPILAGKLGPASTPAGAMPLISDAITPAIQSGLSMAQTAASTGLQRQQAATQASVRTVNESRAQLNSVQSELKGHQMPLWEAISTVTSNFADLLKAMDKMIGNNQAGYENLFRGAQETLTEWMVSADKYIKGKESVFYQQTMDKAPKLKPATKKFFLNNLSGKTVPFNP